jgi:DNA-binding transcriptional ArsR family regulator
MADNNNIPELEVLFELADLFKVFGDSTRLRILYTLFDSEHAVGEIADILNMEQSTISHQLRVLRTNKLVKVRREGKQIYYSLDDNHVKKVVLLFLCLITAQTK